MRTQVIEGVTFESTPGHGHWHLTAERLAQVPAALRTPTDCYSGEGIFEEDVEWARVALSFPEELPELQERAEQVLRNFHPEIWEEWTGKTLEPGQSQQRDRDVALAEHANDLVAISAWGSWHDRVPAGKVGVLAVPGKHVDGLRSRSPEAEYFLVRQDRYQARPESGYVIDQAVDGVWAIHP